MAGCRLYPYRRQPATLQALSRIVCALVHRFAQGVSG